MDHLLPRDSETDSGVYDYAAPNAESGSDIETALVRELSETRPFKRLADIRFLGALDYCLVLRPNGAQSNARFTRAQHSAGVAAIARAYLKLTQHSTRSRLACIASAMLHDIGHPPFSHTLEPVFEKHFGINHHYASELIIRGEMISDEIPKILNKFGVNVSEVIDILNGNDSQYHGFFAGPINFDTIEGILRSRNYLRMQSLGITPLRVVDAATRRDGDHSREIVDAFWLCKDEMYNLVIRSKLGVLFDTLFQEAAEDIIDRLSPEDFYTTETSIFRRHSIFRDATQRRYWKEMASALLPDESDYLIRRFYIDEEGDFFSREDRVRYRQSKQPSSLTLKSVVPS